MQKSRREKTLDAARDAALRDRAETYGDVVDNFSHTADLWNAHIGDNVLEPHEVVIAMILAKIARIRESPLHMDNWVDIAGYAACGAEVAERTLPTAEEDEP